MNEVEFVKMSRTLFTGDLVLFHHDYNSHIEYLAHIDRINYDMIAGAGFVLSFVDSAKPLLIYRSLKSHNQGETGIDFFQDVIYASEPDIHAEAFTVYRKKTLLAQHDREQWMKYLQKFIGMPLLGDTPLFDAYAMGIMGSSFQEIQQEKGAFYRWICHHLEILGLCPGEMILTGEVYSIWEDHDVYNFS